MTEARTNRIGEPTTTVQSERSGALTEQRQGILSPTEVAGGRGGWTPEADIRTTQIGAAASHHERAAFFPRTEQYPMGNFTQNVFQTAGLHGITRETIGGLITPIAGIAALRGSTLGAHDPNKYYPSRTSLTRATVKGDLQNAVIVPNLQNPGLVQIAAMRTPRNVTLDRNQIPETVNAKPSGFMPFSKPLLAEKNLFHRILERRSNAAKAAESARLNKHWVTKEIAPPDTKPDQLTPAA
jgi:hypothetical protein